MIGRPATLNGTVSMSRSDWILWAFQQYVSQHRDVLDMDKTLQKVVVHITLESGGGYPRGLRCNFEHEEKLTLPTNSH